VLKKDKRPRGSAVGVGGAGTAPRVLFSQGALRAEDLARGRASGGERVSDLVERAGLLRQPRGRQDPKARDALRDGSANTKLSEALGKLLGQVVGGEEEGGGLVELSQDVLEGAAFAKPRRSANPAGSGLELESLSHLLLGLVGREQWRCKGFVGGLLNQLKGWQRKVRLQGGEQLREGASELAQLGYGEPREPAVGREASFLGHAGRVLPSVSVGSGGVDDGGCSGGREARGAECPSKGTRTGIEAPPNPPARRRGSEGLHQGVIVRVVGFWSGSLAAGLGVPGTGNRSERLGAFSAGRGPLGRGLIARELEEALPVESETFGVDDERSGVVFFAAAVGVLELVETVGLGVEAEGGDAGSAVFGEPAIEASEFAKEAENPAKLGLVVSELPGARGVLVAAARVAKERGEGKGEVPVGGVVGLDAEEVGDAGGLEKPVQRLPRPKAVAVEEVGGALDELHVGGASVEAGAVADAAPRALGVDLFCVA